MEHTPGPWKWFNDGDLANSDGKMVLRPDANRGIPTDADAALIAAAPDLLKACDELCADLTQQGYQLRTHPFDKMLLAVRKAKGLS